MSLRHTLRSLRRAPGTTVLTVLTMAVGLGASAVVFALVDAVVLRPLPYPQADQLVRVFDVNQAAGVDRSGIAIGNLFEWRRAVRMFDGIAGYYEMGRTAGVGADAYPVIAAQVTEDFFRVAGVAALVGRTFTPDDAARATYNSGMMPTGVDPVVIVSHAFWRSRMGGDLSAVGRTVLVERLPFRVVGVMPPGFALPTAAADIWLPWNVDAKSPRDQHYLGGLARLAAGVTRERAEAELNGVASALAQAFPVTNGDWRVRLVPLHDEVVGSASRIVWLLLAAVALLQLAACANVALVTLTRGVDRAGEAAVRLALGASPSRLVGDVLLASLLQSAVAGVLGAALAQAAMAALPTVAPDLPRVREVVLAPRVWLGLLVVTALSGVLTGALYAWRRARIDPAVALAASSRRLTSGGTPAVLRHAMTAAQVALAVVLLTGAGLLVRSVRQLASVDVGFTPEGVLVAPVFLDAQGYRNGDQVRAYYGTLFERIRGLPGVTSVGGSTTVPASPLGPDFARPVWPQGADESRQVPASVRIVTSGYGTTMGLRLTAGRDVADGDGATAPRVVVVSAGLAEQLWPGESAVGKALMVDYSTAGTYPYEVIGVVGDVRFRGPRSEPDREIYLAHAQRPYLIMNVVVKATGDIRRLAPEVGRVMRELDPLKPPQHVRPLTDLMRDTYARDRLTMLTLGTFAGLATLLAMLSVYGVLSHMVRARRRDIAIRMAMGATAGDLLGWVAGAGGRVLGAGILAGLAATRLVSRAMTTVLYGIPPTDTATTVAVVGGVLAIGALATVAPWYRATRVSPVETLRHD